MTVLAVAGLTLLACYLIGAIPFGYLVARWRGVDIFQLGSGNIGATNVGRVLGRRFGILVFLFDFAKGALPVLAATEVSVHLDGDLSGDALRVGAGLAAVIGHMFPVYLRFRGGKGVATGAGVVAMLLPQPVLGALLVWMAVVCATHFISLASLTAAAALCVLRFWLTPEPFAPENRWLTVFCFLAAGLILLRHRANVTRLLHGNENRLKDTPTMHAFTRIVHVLALGLWFGSGLFFSFVVALTLFHSFEALGEQPPAERPDWLNPSFNKENGTQLAGMAVGPLFHPYFKLQLACGLLAVATALAWLRAEPRSKIHKVRSIVLMLALAGVLAGWPLVEKIDDLRAKRYAAEPADVASAKAEFGKWHGYSLLLNMATLAFVTVGMALAAQLPNGGAPQELSDEKEEKG